MGPRPVRLVLGNFDGIHKGHRELISRLVTQSIRDAESCVVVTFDPHPAEFFGRSTGFKKIDTPSIKRRLLASLGVTGLLELAFDAELSSLSGEKFIQDILEVFPLREILVGRDFRFGRDRSGSVELLRSHGTAKGFDVTEVNAVMLEGSVVSSSALRKILAEDGDVAGAARMLERPFILQGQVIQGDQIGRKLGFPTANLSKINQIIPKAGVYSGTIKILDDHSSGVRSHDVMSCVINIGYRPTVSGEARELRVEAHIYDQPEQPLDLYGEDVEIEFIKRIRDEKRFDNLEALKAQITKDIASAMS